MRIDKKRQRVFMASVSAVAILMGANSNMAFAQDNNNEDAAIEEVVVTGTRIKRSEFTMTTPAQTMDSADIRQGGFNELSELITELPSIAEATSPENSQSSTQNSGSATISLRNLGSDRTLVLIDGRRTVSNSSTSSVISLDTIPSGFIERVEVITGGASAVYGSDAVTGVVNLITRSDFEGLEFNARFGGADQGGESEKTFELTAGANFSENRGNILINFTYDKEGPIYEHQRDFAMINSDIEGDFSGSGNIPGGRFRGDDYGFFNNNNQYQVGAYDGDLHSFDYRGPATISIPKDRYLLATKVTYDLTDNVEAFFHGQFSHIYSRSQRAADTAGSNKFIDAAPYTDPVTGEVTYHEGVPLDNPFIPKSLLADAIEDGDKSIQFRRRWIELGNRWRGGTKDTYRFWTGLKGSIDENWDWEVFYGHHEFRQAQNRVGDLVKSFFAYSVNVEEDPDNPGDYRCKNETARIGGCVPLNLFGQGNVTPEAADYVMLVDSLHANNEEKNAGGFITGDFFSLPAGNVGVAAGVEWRDVLTKTTWDPLSKASEGTVTGQTDQFGTYNVKGAYIEANVPLVSGGEFAKYMGIELAARVDDYSSVGNVYSYKAGLTWATSDDFRLRATYARAQRAPNTIELFATGIGSQGPISEGGDPCDGVTLASTGTVASNCLSEAGILTNIADNDGEFIRNFDEQVQSPLRGNLNVQEETATTYTIGAVYTPNTVPGFSMSMDYYDIKIKDAIGSVDEDEILFQCYNSVNFLSSDVCGAVTRDNLTGDLVSVNRTYVNLQNLRSTGIDTAVSYNFDIDGWDGNFSFKLLHSYIINLEQNALTSEGLIFEDNKGLVGNSRHQARASLSWANEGLVVRWKALILGGAKDEDFDPNEDTTGWVHDFEYGTYIRNDLFLSYDLDDVLGGGATLYGGVNNLMNTNPPLMLDGSGSENVANTNSTYDIVGRFYYAGVKFRF